MNRSNRSQWSSGLVLVAVVIGSVFLTAFRPFGPEEAERALTGLLLPLGEDDCSAECVTTTECDEWQHAWITAGVYEGWLDNGGGHPCSSPSSCDAHRHSTCEANEEEENLDALEMALAGLSGQELLDLIDENPDRLLWNPDRGTIQLKGCWEMIDLSIQVSEGQAEAMNDA